MEVCTLRGLVTHHVLFFLDLASRAVKIGGITIHPNDLWMSQVARNLTDAGDQFFHRTRLRGCIPVQIGAWRCAKARRPAW